jgi:hypothetical protein
MTRENIADIYAVQTKANDLNCEDFVQWVKDNASKWENKGDILQFRYKSILAIADIKNDCLRGYFEGYIECGDFTANLYCQSVEFN